MGEVYEVEHDLLETRRAVKVLVKEFAHRRDLTERMLVEARGLARLKHPNLVEVYDLGTAADGRIFFVMELLDGATLRAMLAHRSRLSARTSVELVLQVLAGLQASHDVGMIHRDVKPENVFVCRDGVVKLLDFGVAKIIDAWIPKQKITAKGMTVGTPRYMSPEQALGEAVDARADVYATGQMLWEMLAGCSAFSETNLMELLLAKRRGLTPLSKMPGVDASPSLCAAVDRACRPAPSDRFPSALDFYHALRAATAQNNAASDVQLAETRPDLSRIAVPTMEDDTRTVDNQDTKREGMAPFPSVVAGLDSTEPLETPRAINRVDPTPVNTAIPMVYGPGGTVVLPAVAASRPIPPAAPPQSVGGSTASPVIPHGDNKRGVSFLGVSSKSWATGGLILLVPAVLLLGFFGGSRLRETEQ